MRRVAISLLFALSACADAQTDPSQEIDPAGNAGGQAGASGSAPKAGSAGQGGSGNAGGQGGGQAGGGAGGQAGSSQAGGGQGGSAQAGGGQAGSAQAGGGQGGSAQAGGGQAGEGQPFGGAAGTGGSAAGQGGSSAGGQGGSAGAGSGGSSQAGSGGGAGGANGGAAGDGPFGGSAGQPFGGGSHDKICPELPKGGAAGAGGSQGTAGGFCASDKLGNPNDDPCYTCWNGSREGGCKQAFAACEASADCVAFFACWSSCAKDEDSCFKKCSTAVPAGVEAYAAVRDCVYLDVCPEVCAEQCQGIGSANRCNHTVCATGYDLDPDCSPCAATVCESDSTCCAFEWDGSCKSKAESLCKIDCDAPPAGCVHSECATGAPLDKACSPCASKVCEKMPLCCQPFGKWDLACAEAADALCGP